MLCLAKFRGKITGGKKEGRMGIREMGNGTWMGNRNVDLDFVREREIERRKAGRKEKVNH